MIATNYNTDIGYLVSLNGNILPIRPIQVDKNIQKNGIKYRKGEILYIHDQIIRYYILKGFIKKLIILAHRLGMHDHKEYMTTIAFPVKVPYYVFEDTVKVPFENAMLPVVKNYEEYLESIFGPDYMQEPTEKEKMEKIHQPEILDLHKSYLEYLSWDRE